MTLRVAVEPKLLAWAVDRSGLGSEKLHARFPKLGAWLGGALLPTLKQAETFAKATHIPLGYLFLQAPPEEAIPIPDYRTIANAGLGKPSADLLDTLYLCQQRQDWYRDYARANGMKPLAFVGSVTVDTPVEMAAHRMGALLGTEMAERQEMPTWEAALKNLMTRAEGLGIMVMCNGIVGNNTRRKLNPDEFRGFALTDALAPLVFINGADTKSAQIFTLAHELAHLWLGETALSDIDFGIERAAANPVDSSRQQPVEQWCNAVAAELLVPRQLFEDNLRQEPLPGALRRLTRHFKVSSLVVLRRMKDVGYLQWDEYNAAYERELERLLAMAKGKGGNFYLSQPYKLSRRFASALMVSTLEGHTLYRDAMRMLSIKKAATFNELGRTLGVPI